ncbi:hypothetical protein L2E82_04219 [Cichorium intybus]|uniref:Uncharacterized protein n=1 Tax=Cichorium intybus TaxID=13427 RepID=A0ACB9H5N9_CICIN|nr:hypothetical protein L2E82_04219 [Cichorium intybus]
MRMKNIKSLGQKCRRSKLMNQICNLFKISHIWSIFNERIISLASSLPLMRYSPALATYSSIVCEASAYFLVAS